MKTACDDKRDMPDNFTTSRISCFIRFGDFGIRISAPNTRFKKKGATLPVEPRYRKFVLPQFLHSLSTQFYSSENQTSAWTCDLKPNVGALRTRMQQKPQLMV